MKILTCTKKVKNKKNIVKTYHLVDTETNEEMQLTRRELVKILRDKANYTVTNLKLTYNNRVTHSGALSTKAQSVVED